jgi:cytochrome-b5 reductase
MSPVIIAIALAIVIAAFLFFKKSGSTKRVSNAAPVALTMSYHPFTMVRKEQVSHDTFNFRFALQSPQHRLGLPTGKHIFLKYDEVDEKGEPNPISRAYTPISSDDELGYFDLVIKVYPQGKMSQHLKNLDVQKTIDVRGPFGELEYKGNGVFGIKRKNPQTNKKEEVIRKVKNVGMIAGGTGITPMLQIVRDVCKHYPKDQTNMNLIFANKTEQDILLREELVQLTTDYKSVFSSYLTLDNPPQNWQQGTGFVSADMIRANLPGPASDTLILVCGPPPMCKFMETNLKSLNYTEDMYFIY